MENRQDKDISASELLAKLKASIAESEPKAEDTVVYDASDKKKRYKFRRSEKNVSAVTEEEILREMPAEEASGFVSPVPKSDIEDLDIDALMKKYLPEEEYEKMTRRNTVLDAEQEDELVRTLSSIETVKEEIQEETDIREILDEEQGEIKEDELLPKPSYGGEASYAAPDSELFAHLSEGGKVCDIPQSPSDSDDGDTLVAPLRPMTDTVFAEEKAEPSKEENTVPFAVIAPETDGQTTVFDYTAEAVETEEPKNEAVAEESAEEASEVETAEPSDTVVFDLSALQEEVSETETASAEDLPETEDSPEDGEVPLPETEASSQLPELFEEETPSFYSEDAADFDETDANLMIAFGMDEELDKALGKENADKLRSDMDNMLPDETEKPKKQKKPAETVREFISPAETKEIFDTYRTEYGKSSLRMFGVIAVVIVLFFYENITVLGGGLIDALKPEFYPVVNIMAGLQLLFIGFAILYKSFIKGIRGLVDRKPVPESFLPILLLISVIYSVCACFFLPGTEFVTFYFPASLSLLFTAVNERLDLRREIMTFNIVSSKRTKFALEKLDIDDAELETKAFDEFLPKQPSIFKINKTAFIDGYFRRTRTYPSIKLILGAFIPASVAIAVIGLLVGFVVLKNWQSAVMLGYTAFSFSLPATAFLTFGLPAFRASKLAFADKSAFVGEAALDEYTTAASISFDDREVFPTSGVKLRSVKVFGSGRIDTVIYNVASIYSVLGGPLSDVLNVATADLGHSEDVEILSVDNEGVEAVVEGRHLYAGKADYLRKNGYVPVSDPDDEDIEESGEISMMYLVCDDEVVAKLYVRYRIDPGFEVTLKRLYKSGICVGIKTVDPNINDAMLSTKIKLTKYPVRVLKYSDVSDSRRGADRTDSGVVSKKSAKALLSTFTLCDKVKHVTNTNLVVNIITMVLGLVIAIAVAFLGSVTCVSSLYVALFQAFWLIPVLLMSKFML